MEYDKINKLLHRPPEKLSKFVTKKWIKVNDHSKNAYDDKKTNKI